jgi:hypothetical protein
MENQNIDNQTPYVNPTINNQQPQIPVQKNNNSVVIILCLVIVILVGVSAYLFGVNQGKLQTVTPTPSNLTVNTPSENINSPITANTIIPMDLPNLTANWQKYSNSKYGFSFKYPNDWKLEISPTKGEEFNITLDKKSNTKEIGFVPIQFSINMAQDQNGTVKITTISEAEKVYRVSKSQNRREILIDKKSVVVVNGNIDEEGPSMGLFLQYDFVQINNEVLVIQLGNKDYSDIFDQILSTLTFNK